MGLKRAFARSVSHRQRSLVKSSIAALVFFILFTAITLFLITHQRMQYQHAVEERTQKFTQSYIDRLTGIMQQMLPLTAKHCVSSQGDITYQAAFTPGVRTFLLVRNGFAYCSSATGDMMVSLKNLYPEIDAGQNLDLKLQQGTPMVPDKPAIALWLRQPGGQDAGILATLDVDLMPYLLFTSHDEQAPGIAIVMGERALTTFSPNLMPVSQLPQDKADRLVIPGLPLTILFYNEKLTPNDIRLTLLGSLVLSLMIGVLCYYMLLLRLSPERALLRGIRRNEFFIEYQPVFHTRSGTIGGLEALIRWQHPLEGRIPPDLFIPYAESAGLIVPLTRHLFSLIAADAPQLAKALPKGAKIGLNISPSHLSSPSFHQDVYELLAQLPGDYFTLVFEITERGMVEEESALAEFDWLHKQGIEIAIDDFGTGHSALIYLERFSMDYLKIDRGFVNSIGQDTVTAPVLDAVISLAKKLKMLTVAEGVESAEQMHFLQEHDVNYMQGYYFSKPLRLEDFVTYCNANQVFDYQTLPV
ncbi:cyclic di-GMP phosphodiesterase [Serratia entomophila]|uniref:cyclic-guanylate-specific phosphodiesterase n=1 Tax=Serratia entomophila TaxID=42906 RepID=A0ABY5CPN0_9GAMM|nr:cyclic di-GMP phosphodiesterase [Serratia entomophila]USU99540.1 cyclic di-GMP phosphodiesterase [Serratia entomophila]CAI0698094.1 phage resistance protein [Serratia entomophila]CAI0698798.1 phage resistance protein [Serratia entomophila]CAI0699523.1 phage resistance protein [Serratia entomophila]CAI0699717.1 phage resistance protein [Serratia entomophila]